MSLSREAQAIYRYLVGQVVPAGKVTTYSSVSTASGVEIGVDGGHIGRVLGEIADACDMMKLPPLTAIVVHKDEMYDDGKHGMPGTGYFIQEATSPNNAERPCHDQFMRWGSKPKPPEVDRWELRDVVEHHQDSVFEYANWPPRL